jgi:hypothetical protein
LGYASGLSYEQFWNATWPEVLSSIDGYLKRQEDQMRGIRKICWHVVLPWIKENERGTEFDVFAINGDPTPEEMEAMRKKANEQKNKDLVKKLQEARQILDEHDKAAGEWMSKKM